MMAGVSGALFSAVLRSLPLLVLIIGPILATKPAKKAAGVMWGGAITLLVSGLIGIVWSILTPILFTSVGVGAISIIGGVVLLVTILLDIVGFVLLFIAIAKAGKQAGSMPATSGAPAQGPYAAQAQQGPFGHQEQGPGQRSPQQEAAGSEPPQT